MRSKNLAILVTVLILGGILLVLASYYFDVDPLNQVACQEDAKVCSDGSTVVRGGPNCEFPACPEVAGEDVEPDDSEDVVKDTADEDFRFALEEAVRIEIGQPIEGYEPQMFMQVFPGLKPRDFDGVEAMIGVYKYDYENDVLIHELGDVELIHSAAPAITEEGMNTLLTKVTERIENNTQHNLSVEEIIEYLLEEQSESPTKPFNPVACTMDAKQCPDGSYVGRVGPDCEFAPCPDTNWPIVYGEDNSNLEKYRSDCERRLGVFNTCSSLCTEESEVCADVCVITCEGPASEQMPPVPPDSTFCTPTSRSVDACIEIYQPVCGQVEVQCITTPCNPVPETFSNSCFACMNPNVVSYTEGDCEGKLTI